MELINIPQNFETVEARLSDQCPPVIDKAIEQIFSYADNPFGVGAVIFNGWYGIGKERILQYAAKRAVELKGFEVVIWMIERKKNVPTLRKFQRRVAEQLGVASSSKNDDSDDDEEQNVIDNVIAGRIGAYLEDKKFIVVHNGGWELSDLENMGIPIHLSNAKKTIMVLVASSNKVQRYHYYVSLEERGRNRSFLDIPGGTTAIRGGVDLSDEDVWDLVREVCVNIIADYPILRRAHHISPEVMMKCIIMCSSLKYSYRYSSEYWVRYWFSEGYIMDATLDLKKSFDIGQVLLEALEEHCILDSSLDDVIKSMPQLNGYSDKVLQVQSNTDLLNKSPLYCSKLSILKFDRLNTLPESIFEHTINVRILDLSYQNIQSLPSSSMINLVNLRFLNLCSCWNLDPLQLSLIIKAFKKIEILDLSKTSLIKELPDDFFDGIQSLRLLDLSYCSKLLSLPSSMSCLINLEHLSLASCEQLSCIPSSIHGLEKLQVLYLSKTKLTTIPQQFFQNMYKLKVVDLSFNRLLKSIHMSVSNLVNCEKLDLQSCESLQTITPWLGGYDVSLPIQDLNLSSCSSLQNIDHVISSPSTTFSNIKSLNLSFTPVNQLSLKSCSSLETIHLQSNTTLEKLDLSGTKLNNFLLSGDDLNVVPLKHLVFLNKKPRGLNNCGDGSTPHMHIQPIKWRKDGNGDGAFISVENANIFRSLTSSQTFWARFLVYVCPCEERGKQIGLPLKKVPLLYEDIFSKFKRMIPSYERCIEIERVSKFPKAISVVLGHTQYLTLHDERAIVRLSDFGIENMKELKACFLQRCRAMKVVFVVKSQDQPLLSSLEKLQISDLMKLASICDGSIKLDKRSFSQLKHLQIEHCPQLINMFSCSVFLESLETLQIKFCARLEEIFSGKENEEGSLKQLQTFYLLELPALKSIVHNVNLVSLNEAKVKGCPRLRELPLQSKTMAVNELKKTPSIVVTGELDWWKRLEWKDNNVKDQITFNAWEPFKFPKNR